MSRVLLVSTNRCASPDIVFPLGLCQIDTALRRSGYVTRCVDLNLERQPLDVILADFRPDIVGLSVRNIDDVLIRKRETYSGELTDLCQAIRRQRPCPIVLGGSGFSIFPRELLERTGADYGIQGEGEVAFVRLLEALGKGSELSEIGGLVSRYGGENGSIPRCQPALTRGADIVERPSDLAEYYLTKTGMLNVQTQRGCAHECCYCTYPTIEGRTHRRRPAGVVVEEMAAMEAQGAKYAFVVDSVFNSSPRHVREMCEALIERRLKIHWGCFLRPQNLTPELVDLMAGAGLTHIEFGSDSFCDPVLEAYQKRLTFDDIRYSSGLATARGIDYCHFLICGGPGETQQTLDLSYERSLELRGAVIMATVGMRIYPGTALWQRAIEEGRITAKTNLLEPAYYLAPGLDQEGLFDTLKSFSQRSPNWIPGDPQPGYVRFVERLRARGVAGPLWSYFSILQRLWPHGAATPVE